MDIFARAAADRRDITREIGRETKMTLVSPCGFSANVPVLLRDISQVADVNIAVPVLSRQIGGTVNIADLIDAQYPYKNENNEIFLRKHKAEIMYPTGETVVFEISDFRPDRFFNIITLILDVKGKDDRDVKGRFTNYGNNRQIS
jgi:hypothetical protein